MYKTLYIIGNGFDKAHSMPVGYGCFRNYLEKNNGKRSECANCIYRYNEICSTKCYLLLLLNTAVKDKDNWSDFEEALAKIDFRELNISSLSNFDNLIDNFSECLQEAFHSWIDSINIPPSECCVFKLDTSAFFLTFNYTTVLERMYKIPPANVYHVHSSFIEKQNLGRKYVFGHSATDTRIQAFMKSQIHEIDESLIDEWSIALGRLKKESFSESHILVSILQNANLGIPVIKIIGHSFGRVDHIYFAKLKELFPNAKWIYYYHSANGLCDVQNNVNLFKKEVGNIDISYEQLSTIMINNIQQTNLVCVALIIAILSILVSIIVMFLL